MDSSSDEADRSWRTLYAAGAVSAGVAVVLYAAALVLFAVVAVALWRLAASVRTSTSVAGE